MHEHHLETREVTRLVIPMVGRISQIDDSPGTVLLDASGVPVPEVSDFFRTMLASGQASARSGPTGWRCFAGGGSWLG